MNARMVVDDELDQEVGWIYGFMFCGIQMVVTSKNQDLGRVRIRQILLHTLSASTTPYKVVLRGTVDV